jgi:hypothetical protein
MIDPFGATMRDKRRFMSSGVDQTTQANVTQELTKK